MLRVNACDQVLTCQLRSEEDLVYDIKFFKFSLTDGRFVHLSIWSLF